MQQNEKNYEHRDNKYMSRIMLSAWVVISSFFPSFSPSVIASHFAYLILFYIYI